MSPEAYFAMVTVVVVTASLRFARWAIERSDRLEERYEPLTSDVLKLRKAQLLKERQIRQDKMQNLIGGGWEKQAAEQSSAIQKIDHDLSSLEDYEYAAGWRGMVDPS